MWELGTDPAPAAPGRAWLSSSAQALPGKRKQSGDVGNVGCLPDPWKDSSDIKLPTERTGLVCLVWAQHEEKSWAASGSKDKGTLCVQLKRNLQVYFFMVVWVNVIGSQKDKAQERFEVPHHHHWEVRDIFFLAF